ncbi:MAG: hypothetical protein OEM52_10720 [bacterium]|nr:hypothetical protein [bacterium]
MLKKWLSRKLLATLAAILTSVLVNQIGLPPETAQQIVDAIMVIVSSYLLGQSAVDVATTIKQPLELRDQ